MAADPEAIACWQRLGPAVTTSGRLTAPDIAALGDLGVRHVINLALVDSPGAMPNEAELLAARAIRYTHIPVPFSAPSDSHFAAFRAALARDEGPVHVHCIMNWRVSAFFYRHHRLRGMPKVAARGLMVVHWLPEISPHADAPAWARFIAEG
ncbi:MAG: sulfur transferase domain-containing protein [Novosphingobium sp.]